MTIKRRSFPVEVETQVILKCRRRCAFCYSLESDLRWKKGQLAHIDRDRTNVKLDNAAYLCTVHHDEYDSIPSQTKRLTPAELKAYQAALYEVLDSPDWLRIGSQSVRQRRNRKRSESGIAFEMYDRRLPVYRTAVQFVRAVVKDLRPDLPLILQFAADTEEALFLFDETIAGYLAVLFKKALRLHTINLLRERIDSGGEVESFSALVREETDLAMWFADQYDVIRNRFAPFLRVVS